MGQEVIAGSREVSIYEVYYSLNGARGVAIVSGRDVSEVLEELQSAPAFEGARFSSPRCLYVGMPANRIIYVGER